MVSAALSRKRNSLNFVCVCVCVCICVSVCVCLPACLSTALCARTIAHTPVRRGRHRALRRREALFRPLRSSHSHPHRGKAADHGIKQHESLQTKNEGTHTHTHTHRQAGKPTHTHQKLDCCGLAEAGCPMQRCVSSAIKSKNNQTTKKKAIHVMKNENGGARAQLHA